MKQRRPASDGPSTALRRRFYALSLVVQPSPSTVRSILLDMAGPPPDEPSPQQQESPLPQQEPPPPAPDEPMFQPPQMDVHLREGAQGRVHRRGGG